LLLISLSVLDQSSFLLGVSKVVNPRTFYSVASMEVRFSTLSSH
jgi:hypothetical protein